MKKFLSIIVLLSILSYAQLGNALKSLGKSLTENCSKCNTEYDTLYDYECNDIRNESQFRKCSDFVENCKCWTRAGDRIENEGRANLFQVYQNQLLEYKARVQKSQEQTRQDSIRRESERREQAKRDSIRQVWREQEMVMLQENILKKTEEMKQLLKENKLQECAEECYKPFEAELSKDSLFRDLCEKQLANKIRKLPKNKIKTVALARLYYNNPQQIMGYIFRDEGKFVWMQDLVWKHTVMVQYSAGYIGECRLRPNHQIPFAGYAIYLGDVHTVAFGNVPNYQLLWCEQ
jgi:hypothetical protein